MSECLKHSMVISGESSSANMKPSWSSTNCLSPSSSLQDISQVYISPPGCFCGYGFCTIHGFPVVQVRHTPTGLFLHRSKPPHFHVLRNAPVLETAGSPCIEPYITGLYQHAVAAMHIVFDALLIPGHEWDTGEIPEHNVISIHGIYEERQGTFTVSGNKKTDCHLYGDTGWNVSFRYVPPPCSLSLCLPGQARVSGHTSSSGG